MKISIIGAGNVGSTLALRTLEGGIGDVVLIDIVEGLAEGKALDIQDASSIMGVKNNITGTSDFKAISGSDIVVVTAGLARKPGMTREDLIKKNAEITRSVASHIKEQSFNGIIIVVTNPLDVMAYYMYKICGFAKNKIIGMSGTLDTARFVNIISQEMKISSDRIKSCVIGIHSDDMIPVISNTLIDNEPIRKTVSPDKIEALVKRVKNRGAEIVSYLKTGSAYYSPSAGIYEILKAVSGKTNVIPISAYLDGEYGIKGCFLGVPAEISKTGINKIVELKLDKDELDELRASGEKVKSLYSLLS